MGIVVQRFPPVGRALLLGLAGLCLPATPGAQAADPRPLPDADAFAREVRARLSTDRELQSRYTFLERREEVEVSKLGKVSKGATKVFEVYPSADPGNTYKRLISVDGTPLSEADLQRNDEKHRRDLEDRKKEPEAKRARERARAQQKEQAAIDDIFRVYESRLVRRETIDGHPTILVTLEPRPGSKPRTNEGKLMQKFRVRAWVHERDYQVVKVDAEAVTDVTVGWGLIARVHKGAALTYERRKVNGEVWLPAHMEYKATGRSLLFRTFDIDSTTDWWGYRRLRN
jgi:hypothetical protein